MARLLGAGQEEKAADLAPLGEPIPDGVEEAMEAAEAYGVSTGTREVTVYCKRRDGGAMQKLEEGKHYTRFGEDILFNLGWKAPKHSHIGIRRTGDSPQALYDHMTWYPAAATFEKKKP